jgi:tetratricopeptide (TPR) repeat protein
MTIKVFISYSWDSDAHKHTVLQFSDKLRACGIDCFIDQYINGSPAETWTRWMEKQIEAADFVLVVCTQTYLKRFKGEDIEAGRGVNFEGVIITQILYDAFQHSTKFIPVIPDDGNIDHVPLVLKGKSSYQFVSQFETIWRVLANQPSVSPKPLGELKLPQTNTQSLNKLTPYLCQTPDRVFFVPFAYGQHELFGREQALTELAEFFKTNNVVAICGLGGVGKTRLAVEYAQQQQDAYTAVLWVSAARDFYSEFAKLASQLGGDKQTLEQQSAFVKHWLAEHPHWLLVIDNADDEQVFTPQHLNECVPLTGKVLITTQRDAKLMESRFACAALPLYSFQDQQGADFLLQRLNTTTAADKIAASAISRALTGLPLALVQAVAYIIENQCTLAEYQALYANNQRALLNPDGHALSISDHDLPVFQTFQLSFSRLPEASKQLLQYCAMLDPAAIPEEILIELLSLDALALNARLKPALSYSLLQRNADSKTLSLHRLVGEVLLLELPDHTLRELAEPLVNAVNALFPNPEFENWQQCERLLSSGLACADWITKYNLSSEITARLLNQLGYYLHNRGDYARALPLYEQALAIRQTVLGENHPETANSLNNLASLYYAQGNYARALPLYEQALAIRQTVLGENHPNTAISLNNLALLYDSQGNYDRALPLFEQALAIRQTVLGENHPDTASSLSNLAVLYSSQGDYARALPLYKQALAIRQTMLGSTHPDTAFSLNNLAYLYYSQGDYTRALLLFEQALKILQQALGDEHPHTKTVAENYQQALNQSA